MSKKLEDLSRTLSHALRHEPWLYEIELDEEGWAEVPALLVALHGEWPGLQEADLAEMIARSAKKRHEMVGGRIRAFYGHSLPGQLRKEPAEPPALLFHGTSPEAIPSIRGQGLIRGGRQYVHLSLDRETAVAVGGRKAKAPVILVVRAQEARNAQVPFYLGNENVWLADEVPVRFIDFGE